MKLQFWVDGNLSETTRPRNIRNLILALLEKSGHIDAIPVVANKVKVKNTQSTFVFPKPRSKSFEVISYGNDLITLEKIEKSLFNQTINLCGVETKITECNWKEEGYMVPQKLNELSIYTTRTPIVIAVNPIEYKIVFNKSRTQDDQMKGWLEDKIKGMIKKQYEDMFFGVEAPKMEDFSIKLLEWNKITVDAGKHEVGKYHQAMFCKFVSNYRLPRFVGYGNGMGFGELLNGTNGVDYRAKARQNKGEK